MKKLALIFGAGLAIAGTNAIAQENNNAQTAQANAAQEEETEEETSHLDETVCRTERVTGSRTRVNRTCLTRREWRAVERRTRRDVDQLQGNASGSPIPPDPAAPPSR